MGLTEDDIDPGFIAEARAVVATGTHLSHPRTEAAVLKALRLAREGGAQTALDIDYRPNLWGVAGHGEGESRFVESAAVTAKLQSHAAPLRPDRRHRGGVPHRRRLDRHAGGAARGARGLGRDAGLQAGRRGGGRLRRRDPATPRRRRDGPRLPDRGLQRAGRRRRVHVGAAQGLARRRALAGGAQVRQRLRRLRRQPPRLHPRLSVAGRSCSSSSAAACASRRCARTPSWSRCTGRRTAPATGRSMRVFAFDHRAQLEEMAGATPERIGGFKRALPRRGAAGGGRAARLRHPLRRPARPRGALPRRRLRPLDRPAGGVAGLAAADARARARPRLRRARRVAGGAGRQVPVLLPPRRRRRHVGGAGGDGPPPLRRRPPQPAGVPAGGDPVEGRAGRRRHHAADRPALLRRRAWRPTGGSSSRSRPTPPGRAPARRSSRNDPHTRGVVVLGLDAPAEALAASLALAARHELVRGLRHRAGRSSATRRGAG